MSDPLRISLTPGYVLTANEKLTNDKLNRLGNPTINLSGTVTSAALGPGSVHTSHLQDGILTKDAAGLLKMADGYLSATSGALAKMEAGFFAANTNAWEKFAAGFFQPLGSVIGSSRGLRARTAGGLVYVLFEELVLKHKTSGDPLLVSSVAELTTNTLDVGGALADDAWYYIWVVWDGVTLGALLSASSTLAGFTAGTNTHAALVGVVRRTAAAFVAFMQFDRDVWTYEKEVVAGATAGTNGAWTAMNPTTAIPPIAKVLRGLAGTLGSPNNDAWIAVAGDLSGLGMVLVNIQFDTQVFLGWGGVASFAIPLVTAQTFYYNTKTIATGQRVTVTGYRI